MKPFNRIAVLIAAVTLLVSSAPARAQVQTGSIFVRVIDSSGASVPGATVTISSPTIISGSITGVTDATGARRFLSLAPGNYSVKTELPGFQSTVRENVPVNVGSTTSLDLSMGVKSMSDEITVSAEAPVVDATSANVSTVLSQELLQKTPGGRDIWSLVEYKVPGLITNRPDVGGSSGGLQASFSARGTPNSQNIQFLNGINVGDPSAIGFTGFYYDYDAFEQIQVSTGANDISVPSSGVFLNMVTKTGTNIWSGKVSGFWEGDSTQGQNVDATLQSYGFRPDAGAVQKVSDFAGAVGGPLIKDKLRVYASVRDWRVHVNVPGFPEIENTDMTSGLLNLTWQMNPKNRVSLYASRQYYNKPNRGAAATNEPLSVFHEDDHFTLAQALWNSVLSQTAFLDGRVSFLDIFFPLFQKGTDQSLSDQTTGFLSRAAQAEQVFGRKRLEASLNLQYFVPQAIGGRHEFRVGADYTHMPTTTAVHRIDDLNLFYRSATGQGTSVQFFNSPVNSASNVDVFALFAQDSYQRNRLTITGGVRFETVEGYLPAQSSPPSRWFPTATRTFAEIRNSPKWTTLSPRLSFAFDASGDGRTAIKLAAGRYHYTLGTGTANTINPNFNVSETYAWNDLNRDLKYQDGERGALQSRAGALVTSIDPDLRRPHTDELIFSVEREVGKGLKVSADVSWRRERDLFGNKEVGVPADAFQPVTRPENGPDGVAGTSDDKTITVYNQSAATIGQNRFLVSNSPQLNQDYKGFQLSLTKRFSDNWQMLASYAYGHTRAKADAFANPNQLINSEGPVFFDRPHTFKLSGAYILPRQIELGLNFRTQSGVQLTRTATFALNQGTVTVNVDPRGSTKLDMLTTLDARLARTFKIGGARQIEVIVDGYNLANANTVWDARTLSTVSNFRPAGDPAATPVAKATYLSPLSILGPRIFRIGAAFRF